MAIWSGGFRRKIFILECAVLPCMMNVVYGSLSLGAFHYFLESAPQLTNCFHNSGRGMFKSHLLLRKTLKFKNTEGIKKKIITHFPKRTVQGV